MSDTTQRPDPHPFALRNTTRPGKPLLGQFRSFREASYARDMEMALRPGDVIIIDRAPLLHV